MTSVQPLMPRRKLAIAHPYLGRGGSEAAVMWLIQAFKGDYDITVVTTGGWQLDSLNAYYGTSIRSHEVTVCIAPVPLALRRWSVAAMRAGYLQRFVRAIADQYDVRISAYNLIDWGAPAVHYIQDFSWHADIRRAFDPQTPGLLYQDGLLRRLYLRFSESRKTPSMRRLIHEDCLLAGSAWTRAAIADCCAADCADVVYPPVWSPLGQVPWEAKRNAFVMIGRIAPEKRIERVIAVLDELRRRGHDLGLHLCGLFGSNTYSRGIAALCRERAEWIRREGLVHGAAKHDILATCRFGIQARVAEPFGISVAEMVRAGAIVFASRSGGQAEILDHPVLLFDDVNDAAAKIDAVLRDEALQRELRQHLEQRAACFNSENFMRSARTLIEQYAT